MAQENTSSAVGLIKYLDFVLNVLTTYSAIKHFNKQMAFFLFFTWRWCLILEYNASSEALGVQIAIVQVPLAVTDFSCGR